MACVGTSIRIMGTIRWGTHGTHPPTFSDSMDIICHFPHIFSSGFVIYWFHTNLSPHILQQNCAHDLNRLHCNPTIYRTTIHRTAICNIAVYQTDSPIVYQTDSLMNNSLLNFIKPSTGVLNAHIQQKDLYE